MAGHIIIFLAGLFFTLSFADKAAPAPLDSAVAPSKIAREFNISEDSVRALRRTCGIGYGGVSRALALSQKSGLTAEEILRMKTEQKMGWGRIAKKLELKAGRDYKAGSPARMEKQLEKQEQKQIRAEKKAEKKAEKAERKSAKGKNQ